MLDGTLWDAFGRVQVQSPPNLAMDVPRMCFISGLTGEELMMLVDAFGKSSEQARAVSTSLWCHTDRGIPLHDIQPLLEYQGPWRMVFRKGNAAPDCGPYL